MEFFYGMVIGLACALVGGLVVFVVLYYRMGRPPHGGGSSDVYVPSDHGYGVTWNLTDHDVELLSSKD